MREGWEIKKLGEVCAFQGGSQPPKSNFIFEPKKGYVRFLQIRDFGSDKNITFIPESKKNRYCKEDDILLGRYGASVGKVLVNKAGAYNVAVIKTIPNEDLLNKRYLFFYLTSIEFQGRLFKVASRSAQNGFSKDDIFDFPIVVPPLPEQKRIVAILDKAFAAIAKAKANAEQNLKNAKELFESYLQGVFENRGEGWEEKRLDDVCEIKPPKKEAKDKLKQTDIVTFLPMEDLGILNKEIFGVKERQFKDVVGSYTYFANNDVLLAKITPCFENGKIGIARNLINGIGFGSSEYIVFRTNEKIEPDILYYFLSRQQIRDEGSKRMTGAVGHKRVSKEWIENYLFSFPKSKKKQQSIVKKLDALSAETKKLDAIYQQKIEDLEELKKSVLQKAFNGEL